MKEERTTSFAIASCKRGLLPRLDGTIEKQVMEYTQEIVPWMRKNLPFIKNVAFRLFIHFNYGYNAVSQGGVYLTERGEKRPFIQIAGMEYKLLNTLSITEYHHIAHDDIIGSLWGVPWQKALLATVCHEIAHAYQFHMIEHMPTLFATASWFPDLDLRGANAAKIAEMWKGHNIIWQIAYRRIRGHFMGHRHS